MWSLCPPEERRSVPRKRTPAYEKARDTLPPELRTVFDELVADYNFATTKHYGQGYVAYMALAELIRNGWRPSAEPLPPRIG